jgi:hypothetical protein
MRVPYRKVGLTGRNMVPHLSAGKIERSAEALRVRSHLRSFPKIVQSNPTCGFNSRNQAGKFIWLLRYWTFGRSVAVFVWIGGQPLEGNLCVESLATLARKTRRRLL